ncbi:MAG: ABC transporter substrate-binding protein [Thermomicrobiales bacterium]|nr:ABC transporter substrate-binding protein [Thermomicrobiales bacterium]
MSQSSHPGALSRRTLLKGAAAVGLAAPAARFGALDPAAAAARFQIAAGTLVIGLDGSPSDRDPHSQYDYRSTLVIRGVYEGLLGLKGASTDEYEPLIAESWEPNDDKSLWTFHIRPDVKFHNGDPCDAEAVRASYERLLTMGKGAVGVISRFVTDPAMMSVSDPQTLVFDLGRPQPLFEAALAATYGPQIVNVKVAMEHEEDGDFGNAWLQLNSEGAGTGPFVVTEFDPATGIVMERNPDYWAGWEGDHLDRVIVRVIEEPQTMRQLVEAGEVDIMDRFSVQWEALDTLAANPNLVVDSQTGTEVEYFTMTVGGLLESPTARQALCYAFPYQETIDGVFRGYAGRANSLIASVVRGYAPDGFFFQTDLDKAKALREEAGIPEGTQMTLMMGGGADSTPAELYQANLAQIGITLNIEKVEQSTYTGIFYGDAPAEERPELMRWSWWPDYNDAWNVLFPTTSCESWGSKGSNGGLYCNEEFDDLLAIAKDAPDDATYNDAVTKAQAIITEPDPPVVCTAAPKWPTVLNKRVQGFVFNPINMGTYDFHKLWKTE